MIEGMHMDLKKSWYQTFDELYVPLLQLHC
jgi:phytoene/squalene synthetase